MKQLDPKAVWLFFISYLFTLLPLAFVVVVIYLQLPILKFMKEGVKINVLPYDFSLLKDFFFLAIPIYIVFCYVWARLSYHFYRYELTENGFKKEYGVIWKKYVTVPYEKIQNVDIYRGLLGRLLGLSDLQIQTAGMSAIVAPRRGYMYGAGAEGRLPGLSREVAEALRDELVRRSKGGNAGV